MLKSRTTALPLALVALAMPATALAQSAGDNQYQDPLAGSHRSTSGHSTSSGSSGSSGSQSGSGTSTAAPAGTGTSSGSSGATPQATAAGPSASSGKQLPRTGFELIVPIELGFAMLLAGVTLQRVIVLRDRRD